MTKRTRIRVARRWLLPAMFVYVVLGFAPVIGSENPGIIGLFIIGELAFAAAHVWLPRNYDAEARATADGIWIRERLVVARKSLHSAQLRTRGNVTWLRLQRRGGWVDVALDAPDEERFWLSALRMDAAGIVWRCLARADRSASRAVRTRCLLTIVMPIVGMLIMFGAAGLLLASGRSDAVFIVLALGVGMAVVQLLALGRGLERVTIGADGLTLRRLVGRARFVSFASVPDFRMEARDIVLALRDGNEVAWHTPSFRTRDLVDGQRAFVERINQGLAAHRAFAPSEAAAQLARGTRSISAWVRHLRAAADPGRATYRVSALPPEELWKTIENATAVPTARAGAAVALQRALDPSGRERLRVVAATCASNDLRAALEAAAAGDDLEVRLAALTD